MQRSLLMFLWTGVLFLSACLPEKGKEDATCLEYQTFDSKTRSCVNVGVTRKTPTGTLSNLTVAEDSGATQVTLTYSDINSDTATACYISSASSTLDGDGLFPVSCSCVAGLCRATIKPDTNFSGLAEFRYKIADRDGTGIEQIVGVTVTVVDDSPVNNLLAISPLNGANIDEDVTQTWTLAYTDVESDKGTACNIQNISSNVTIQTGCVCTELGVCTFSLKGKSNFYGNGEYFTYQIYANGKWSSPSTVFFNVEAENDAPTLSATINYEILEGSVATTLKIGLGTGVGALYISGSGSGSGSDVDDTTATLTYALSSAPTSGATLPDCLGNGGESDLECTYTPAGGNAYYNNDYLYDTITVPESSAGGAASVLRLRALFPGTYKNTVNEYALTLSSGGSGGGATVTSVSGNKVTVRIENGVTTAQTIKTALDTGSGSGKFEVLLLGSVPVDVTGVAMPLTLDGGRAKIEQFQYMVSDPDGLTAGPATVNISITPVNDAPTQAANFVLGGIIDEDTAGTITLKPGADVDYQDFLRYRLVGTGPSTGSGTLSNCLDLSGSEGSSDLTCTFTPATNFSDTVIFSYYTNDGTVDAAAPTQVTFTVNPINDNPMICQYSTFESAQECGLNHCVGTGSPSSNNIIPVSHTSSQPVYWYDQASALCWKSTGTTSNDWSIDSNGFIRDYTANQNDVVIIDHIRVDEGGGDSAENVQTLTVKVDSSNVAVVPLEGILIYWDGTGTDIINLAAGVSSPYAATSRPFGDGVVTEDNVDFELSITPAPSVSGSSTITVTVTDSNGNDTFTTFLVTIRSAGAIHNGWANIKALGPKIDRKQVPLNNPYVCSYSESKCNGGQKCKGSSAPGTLPADSLHAIYLNETTPTSPVCYLAEAQVTIGDVIFTARDARPISIDIRSDDTATTPQIQVENRHIVIRIKDSIPTVDSDDIVSAINGNNDAICDAGPVPAADASCLVSASVVSGQAGIYQSAISEPVGLYVKTSYAGKFQNLAFTSKESGVTVEYKTVASAALSVNVIGRAIQVVSDGTETPADVQTALDVPSVTALVDVALDTYNDPAAITAMAATALTSQTGGLIWTAFNTYCNISQSDNIQTCSDTIGINLGAACIGYGSPSTAQITFTDIDQYYYDVSAKTCYRSIADSGDAGTDPDFETYNATGTVTLKWNAFTVSGTGSITGYNVYRRIGDTNHTTFDYAKPVNIRAIASDATSFTEDFTTSRTPPVPSTVYFYEVRPIVDSVIAATTQSHRQVRLISPPPNMAFVHRWIVNQIVCGMMHSEDRDDLDSAEALLYEMKTSDNFYRCRYYGPGSTDLGVVGGVEYYDIGSDFLVDVAEAGCHFTNNCQGTGINIATKDCIAVGSPTTLGITKTTAASTRAVYYDRETGTCYEDYESDGWVAIKEGTGSGTPGVDGQAGNFVEKYNYLHNPPLVNLSQQAAKDFCASTGTIPGIVGLTSGLTKRLPNRLHQVAFSLWDDDINASDISTTETGLSLNASSKCNSSRASGLENSYSTADYPQELDLFSLPAIEASSVYTGSTQTASCVSRFGIQDAIGNVAEFLSDRFRCASATYDTNATSRGMSRCYGIGINAAAASNGDARYDVDQLIADGLYDINDEIDGSGSGYEDYVDPASYEIGNFNVGACVDNYGNDNICDAPLSNWVLEDTSYNAGRFFLPMGLPAYTLFPEVNPNSRVGKSMFAIGSTNGITTTDLHDDDVIINSDYLFASVDDISNPANTNGKSTSRGCGAMVAGGGFDDNSGAGVWHFEMIPCHSAYGYLIIGDFVFRDLDNTLNAFKYDAAEGDEQVKTYGTNGQSIWVGSSTASGGAAWVQANDAEGFRETGICDGEDTAKCDAYYIGLSDPAFGTWSWPTEDVWQYYEDLSNQTANKRTDIGFRCLVEIDSDDGGSYDENQ
ncbi:MAG: hypothetical protein HYV97_11110 [Bdellovibrio sp.]|nr:hypothetical protein [Bdellovibrio sp.]